jgi:hypothetical protein
MDTSGELKPAAREWRLAYRGANPGADVVASLIANPPRFKVGQLVKLQAPAGETLGTDPLAGQVLIIKSVFGYTPWIKNAAGDWQRETNAAGQPLGAQWSYGTDKGGEDPPTQQAWLALTTAAPTTPAPLPAPVTQKQEAAMNLPLYPQGLTVSKGSGKGTVTGISKAADGFHYSVTAGVGPFASAYQGTEAEIRERVAQQVGQQSYGFAFPEGVTLTAGRVSVQIQKRTLADGKRGYLTDQGPIEEPKLILKLYEGLKPGS